MPTKISSVLLCDIMHLIKAEQHLVIVTKWQEVEWIYCKSMAVVEDLIRGVQEQFR